MKYEIRQERMCRLFSILGQLSPHSQVTISDLVSEYEVSERTISRDLEVLERAKLGVFQDDDSIKISRNGYKKIRSWIIG